MLLLCRLERKLFVLSFTYVDAWRASHKRNISFPTVTTCLPDGPTSGIFLSRRSPLVFPTGPQAESFFPDGHHLSSRRGHKRNLSFPTVTTCLPDHLSSHKRNISSPTVTTSLPVSSCLKDDHTTCLPSRNSQPLKLM